MLRTSIVRLLRVILPLAALALLSVLFLLARKPDPQAAIPYARGAIEELSRSPGIGTPEFTTVTADGAQQIDAGHARHVPVGYQKVDAPAVEDRNRSNAVIRLDRVGEPKVTQQVFYDPPHR